MNNTNEEDPETKTRNEQKETTEQTSTNPQPDGKSHETIPKTGKNEIEEKEEEKMSTKHAKGSGDVDDHLDDTKKLRKEILTILNSKMCLDSKSSLLEDVFLRYQKEIFWHKFSLSLSLLH